MDGMEEKREEIRIWMCLIHVCICFNFFLSCDSHDSDWWSLSHFDLYVLSSFLLSTLIFSPNFHHHHPTLASLFSYSVAKTCAMIRREEEEISSPPLLFSCHGLSPSPHSPDVYHHADDDSRHHPMDWFDSRVSCVFFLRCTILLVPFLHMMRVHTVIMMRSIYPTPHAFFDWHEIQRSARE